MITVLAIDPGTTKSGFCLFDGRVLSSGVMPNEDLLKIVRDDRSDALAIERLVNYGSIVGDEVFETANWAGRFQEAWGCPDEVLRITRREVKRALGLPGTAKDKDVNERLRQLVGAKGTKKAPGPTYGVTSHAWAALGVAYAAHARIAREAA